MKHVRLIAHWIVSFYRPFGRYGKMQCVVVKTSYSSPKSLQRHLSYIQREGAGPGGWKPEFFASSKQIQAAIDGEERFFSLILLPEHCALIEAQKGGPQQFIAEFVQRLEAKTRRTIRRKLKFGSAGPLQWCAAVHYNTYNPHAHIIIRGKDLDGRDVCSLDSYSSRRQGRWPKSWPPRGSAHGLQWRSWLSYKIAAISSPTDAAAIP
jgi:hypothetical protein